MFFAIGGNPQVQSRYKTYQWWQASSRIDLLFTALCCLAVGFYCSVHWGHYLLLGCIAAMDLIWNSLLLRVVRTETCVSECMQTDPDPHEVTNASMDSTVNPITGSMLETEVKQPYTTPSWFACAFLILPINLVSPVVLGLSLYYPSFMGTQVPDYAHFLVYLASALFFFSRLCLAIATFFAWRNFGFGMKDVLAKERGVTEFLVAGGRAARGAGNDRPVDAFSSILAEARGSRYGSV